MTYFIFLKISNIISKNSFAILKAISAYLIGVSFDDDIENINNYSIKEIAFKFALVTSVDVEQNFSTYKNILPSNRRSLLFENLSQVFISYCNRNIN